MSRYTFQITLHVLGASVWVGGQIVLAWLVPAVRKAADTPQDGRELVSLVARRFQVLSWSALGLIVATGLWMLFDSVYVNGRLFAEKLVMATLSVVFAVIHSAVVGPKVRQFGESDPDKARRYKIMSGILGVLGLLFAIATLTWGVRLVFG